MAAPNTVTVAPGTNLFAIAAQQYGDATLWWLLAAANGLLDPFIVGIVTLVVPALDRAYLGGIAQ